MVPFGTEARLQFVANNVDYITKTIDVEIPSVLLFALTQPLLPTLKEGID